MLDKLFELAEQDYTLDPHIIVSFLNYSENELNEQYEHSTKISKKMTFPELAQFHSNLKWVLASVHQMTDIEKVEEFLTMTLNEMCHEVVVEEDGIYTQLRADEPILNLWLSIMSDSNYLYGGEKKKIIGQCEWCGKWFVRKRSTRRFCSKKCGNTHYNREVRTSPKNKKKLGNVINRGILDGIT